MGMHREQWIISDNEWTNKERLEIEQLERDWMLVNNTGYLGGQKIWNKKKTEKG